MSNKYRIAIVAPVHIQPTQQWVDALLEIERPDLKIIIVDDSDGKVRLPNSWDIYDYKRQKQVLGDLYPAFEQFHKSSACKNFGHYIAWKNKYDIVIGLDSDCIIGKGFVEQHIEALETKTGIWKNPLERNHNLFSRGYPYHLRGKRNEFNLGLWENCLDLYGKDRMENRVLSEECFIQQTTNHLNSSVIPFSGMNWSMWTENIPAMLFLPNFEAFRRHDDIWGGYIFQRIMNTLKKTGTYGYPIVYHDSIADAEKDMDEEIPMMAMEKDFIKEVDKMFGIIGRISESKSSPKEAFHYFYNVVNSFGEEDNSILSQLLPAFEFWTKLYA